MFSEVSNHVKVLLFFCMLLSAMSQFAMQLFPTKATFFWIFGMLMVVVALGILTLTFFANE